jgi:two-component system nitrate/nitrite response regulator NarL
MTAMIKNSIRILLIDDHKSFMDGLAMVINSQAPAMEVIGTASNRAEAMEAVGSLQPDLILMDMDLGDSVSLDFLPELLEKTSAKVLMLTGMQDPDLHNSAIVKGARGVLLKGESAKVILKAIEKVHAGEIWASNTTLIRILEQMNGSKKQADPEAKKIADLTDREREITAAFLTFEGSTNEEIARQLFISTSTLKNHLTTIYSKLDVKNRVQLMKYALKHKISKP